VRAQVQRGGRLRRRPRHGRRRRCWRRAGGPAAAGASAATAAGAGAAAAADPSRWSVHRARAGRGAGRPRRGRAAARPSRLSPQPFTARRGDAPSRRRRPFQPRPGASSAAAGRSPDAQMRAGPPPVPRLGYEEKKKAGAAAGARLFLSRLPKGRQRGRRGGHAFEGGQRVCAAGTGAAAAHAERGRRGAGSVDAAGSSSCGMRRGAGGFTVAPRPPRACGGRSAARRSCCCCRPTAE